jgi:hypothetical protein
MTNFVNRVEVKPGDVFFVPAGVIHAIGPGCLMLEAQEPSDFTVQPEHWCGDYQLNDHEMYLGLERKIANDCFDFSRYGEEVIRQGKKEPKLLKETENTRLESLIGPEDTTCFTVDRFTVSGGTAVLTAGATVGRSLLGLESDLESNFFAEHLHKTPVDKLITPSDPILVPVVKIDSIQVSAVLGIVIGASIRSLTVEITVVLLFEITDFRLSYLNNFFRIKCHVLLSFCYSTFVHSASVPITPGSQTFKPV